MSTPPRIDATHIVARFGRGRRAEPISPDASTRRFFRLVGDAGETTIALVDENGGTSALDRLQAAADVLREADVPVPEILDRDDELCALAMQDLRGPLLSDALGSMGAAQRAAAYARAGEIAGRIEAVASPRVPDEHALRRPQLAATRLRSELAFFLVHDLSGRRGLEDTGLVGSISGLLDRIADETAALEPRLAHRDFHARNLVALAGGELGVLDFQDALFAPRHYDLASLTRDPYVEPDAALEDAARRAYAAVAGEVDDAAFAWVALQRDLKALGTYAFQTRLRHRERFADAIPAAERLVARALDDLPADFADEARDLLRRAGVET